MSQPPARILQQLLDDQGYTTSHEDGLPWPCFVNQMPDQPHEVVVVSDTTGILDGRLMDTGETFEHPGVQIRVRCRGNLYLDGWRKIKELRDYVTTVVRASVEIDDEVYTIQSVTLSSPVAPMGQDPDAQRRQNFSLNARLTLAS